MATLSLPITKSGSPAPAIPIPTKSSRAGCNRKCHLLLPILSKLWGRTPVLPHSLLKMGRSKWHLRLQPALEDLVGVGIAGAGDPDLVIGKDSVAIRQSHLRHMTSDAVVPRDTAGLLRI